MGQVGCGLGIDKKDGAHNPRAPFIYHMPYGCIPSDVRLRES